MRLVISVVILLIVTGCSSQPTDGPAAASAVGGAPVDPAFARAAKGYKVVRKNGQDMYCRSETPVGSHMSKTVCLTQDQLKNSAIAEQEAREAMRAPRVNTCAGAPGCRN